MNARENIIAQNLDFLERFKSYRNDWEDGFYRSIKAQVDAGRSLSQNQFNKLQDVVLRITKVVA